MQTVTVGPAFGDETSVVVALEGSVIAHERIAAPDPSGLEHPRGPGSSLGIAATAAVGSFWGPDAGLNGFAGAGIDYLPFLYRSGATVGLGGQMAAAAGDSGGPYLVAPRLWFAVPFGDLAGAPLTLGAMLRCQILLREADDDEGFRGGCGPSLVVSRMVLQVSPAR